MKIALVYDYLNQYGGGERVLEVLAGMFPHADIYTIFFDSQKILNKISPERIKGTSFLNKPIFINNHRYFIPLLPRAAESLNLGNRYDLIISVTAGYAKGVSYSRGYHLSYCFTPLRYAWSPNFYLKSKFGPLGSFLTRPLAAPVAHYLRHWDFKMAQRPDRLLTLSRFIQKQIQKCYRRESSIVFPPVDRNIFFYQLPLKYRSYYLAVGRLLHYKRFDIIIKAFNQLRLPLKIVGRGPELEFLRHLNTSPNTAFLSAPMTDPEMRRLYNNAQAFLFPQVEDFGLVAAEALSCGTPVIAYHIGGSQDLIIEGQNGLFIKKQTPEAIIEAIGKLSQYNFDGYDISQSALPFSLENFRQEFLKHIPPELNQK